jgi:hypothetical protein
MMAMKRYSTCRFSPRRLPKETHSLHGAIENARWVTLSITIILKTSVNIVQT